MVEMKEIEEIKNRLRDINFVSFSGGKMSGFLKCKLCDFQTRKFYRRKDGKLSVPEAAFKRIKQHFEKAHPEAFEQIEIKLEQQFGGEVL